MLLYRCSICKPRGLARSLGALLAGLIIYGSAAAREEVTLQVSRRENDAGRRELSVLPVLSYDSDRGLGFGAIGALARFRAGYEPFRWRLAATATMAVKHDSDDDYKLPMQNYKLRLDLPGLQSGRLRLNVELRFSRLATCGYFGLGNRAVANEGSGDFYQYDRAYAQARLQAATRLVSKLFLLYGGAFSYNWVTLYKGSKLEQDLASGEPAVRELLRGTSAHALSELNLGLAWDTRDHEFAPSRGAFHELSWRFSPGAALGTRYAYGGLNFTGRLYHPLVRRWLVLATRLVADILVGDPPFYELARYGGTAANDAPGGGGAIRGVPLHRYHGKIKLVGNLELRSNFLPFTLANQHFVLGASTFFDAGRVWADFGSASELDGHSLGLKFGVGGGPRLQWGETFVVRFDVAWSPDAQPLGFYFNVNHIF